MGIDYLEGEVIDYIESNKEELLMGYYDYLVSMVEMQGYEDIKGFMVWASEQYKETLEEDEEQEEI